MISYTARLRLALVFIALVPPLVAVAAVYVYTSRQAKVALEQQAAHRVSRFADFRTTLEKATAGNLESSVQSSSIQRALLQLTRKPQQRVEITPLPDGLDFVELVDSSGTVLASAHRPGLVGETIPIPKDESLYYATEYDLNGRHAALKAARVVSTGFRLIGGRYFDQYLIDNLHSLLDADVDLHFADRVDQSLFRYEPLTLYEQDTLLQAVLLGSEAAGFVLTMSFVSKTSEQKATSLLPVTVVVSLLSVLAALGVGWYLTGKAKREIENLVDASHRIAGGDFTTPVMAYEEGQFAQLADAFTDMMSNLRRVQRELANSEKIAAWQAMGRKIAHEVKNPLTPIAISVDDLRRSFQEQQPQFDRILMETTGTIKAEVGRLTRLLDQFVSFARMNPPELQQMPLRPLFERLTSLYRTQIAEGRVVLHDNTEGVRLSYDIDRIEQVLVNLVKNGLESAPGAQVQVTGDRPETPTITVTDTGPGFPADVLAHQFEPRISSKSEGFGLGLVICQRIVFDHGGEIWLQNDTRDGATVCFTLRRADG